MISLSPLPVTSPVHVLIWGILCPSFRRGTIYPLTHIDVVCIKATQTQGRHHPLPTQLPMPFPHATTFFVPCLEDQICNLFHNAPGSHTFSFFGLSPPPLPSCNLLFSLLIGSRYCQLTDAARAHTAFKINACPSWSDTQQAPQHWPNSPWTLTQIGSMSAVCAAIPEERPVGIGLLRIRSTFPIPPLSLYPGFPWSGWIGLWIARLFCLAPLSRYRRHRHGHRRCGKGLHDSLQIHRESHLARARSPGSPLRS